MSDFLQRLASGVLHPQQAIHPAVETIWPTAGTQGPGVDEPLATAQRIESPFDASAPPAPQPSNPRSTQPPIQPEPNMQASTSTVHKEVAPPAGMEADAPQPLVASPRPMRDPALAPATPTKANPQQSETISPPPHHANSRERTGAQPPHPFGTASPLLPIQPIPASALANALKAPFVQSLSEERDSIEIHIGRIEVLAAPARQAQPTPPPASRKSLDLGEYLRGERRSR